MGDWIVIVLVFAYIGITVYGLDLRGELKKTEYWEKLPSGTPMFGYCLPVLLFILLNIERIGFVRVVLCILLVLGFIWCVSEENNTLKTKPLEGYSSVLPDDMRKKVVLFYALTPLLTILVLFLIGIILDTIFGISDYMKRQEKNKK